MLPQSLSLESGDKAKGSQDGSAERFESTPLGYCRPAVYRIAHQLSRPRCHFIRAPVNFQRFPSGTGNQGTAAFFLFLVVRADANPDWLVRRPLRFALALCRSVRGLVVSARAYRPGGEPRSVDWFPYAAGHRRVHLSTWRDKDS